MSNLATIRDRVEERLADTGNAIWDTNWIDEGLRQTLDEYSWVIPQRLITTLTLSSDTREIDVSSISGLLEIDRVWTPYTSTDPEDPPNWRKFQHWRDASILYLPSNDCLGQPSNGDVVRIFYTKRQVVEDLDSATATTIPAAEESLLVTGAAGHAAISRALDVQEQVTLGKAVAKEIEAWGKARLDEFAKDLALTVTRRGLAEESRIPVPRLDRYDREWS